MYMPFLRQYIFVYIITFIDVWFYLRALDLGYIRALHSWSDGSRHLHSTQDELTVSRTTTIFWLQTGRKQLRT